MSEAERYLMRQRLNAGRWSKVQRGESMQRLPTGFVRLPAKPVVQDPDPQIRHVIALVLAKFEELGSGARVLRCCKHPDIRLPRRQVSGPPPGELLWRLPSEAAIGSILTNPAYAGAVVHGRRTSDPTRHHPARRTPAMVRRPRAEWQWIIHDAYPAYLGWEPYLTNQARLHDNAQRYTEHGGLGKGAPREGAALLQGLAPCGRCGHRMRVSYRPHVHYVCEGLYRTFAEPACARLDGPSIEAFVIQAFCNAIAPAQLETLDEVLAPRQRERHRLETYHQQQVSQARYDATVARHRYEQVDAAYRLVAAKREREWENTLRALRQAQEAAERFAQEPDAPTLTAEQRRQLLHLSQTLPELWHRDVLGHPQRQALLRSLIARVIATRTAADRLEVKSVWVSGHVSQGVVIPPILRQRAMTGYATMVKRLHPLWRAGQRDTQIAMILGREGFRSARRAHVSAATVLQIRHQHQWVSRYQQQRLADKMDGMWTVRGLAQHLGGGRDWLYNRIRSGWLGAPAVMRRPPSGHSLLRDESAWLDRLRTEVTQSGHGESASPP